LITNKCSWYLDEVSAATESVSGLVSESPLSVLRSLKARIAPTATAAERVLPVRSDLASLLPLGGFRRGTVAQIAHGGLLYVALGEAMAEGAWAVFVGAPSLGLAAAFDHGISAERLAIVATPPPDQCASVIAALVDAVDLVVLGSTVVLRAADARRLSARLRERNGVLVSMGVWPDAVEVTLEVTGSSFAGIDRGHGHLQGWSLEVQIGGRGAAARGRRGTVALATRDTEEIVSVPIETEPVFRLERVS
jgi:hypothetical protein